MMTLSSILAATYLFAANATPTIHVHRVAGEVTYNNKIVHVDEKLPPGGLLVVGPADDAFIDITLKDGHEFRLKNKTRLKLSGESEVGPSELELIAGKVFAYFAKTKSAAQIHLRSPAAVAGVRGTKFLFEHDPAKGTYICVCDGIVHVDGGAGSVDVRKDQDLWAYTGKPLAAAKESKSMSQMTEAEFTSMGH